MPAGEVRRTAGLCVLATLAGPLLLACPVEAAGLPEGARPAVIAEATVLPLMGMTLCLVVWVALHRSGWAVDPYGGRFALTLLSAQMALTMASGLFGAVALSDASQSTLIVTLGTLGCLAVHLLVLRRHLHLELRLAAMGAGLMAMAHSALWSTALVLPDATLDLAIEVLVLAFPLTLLLFLLAVGLLARGMQRWLEEEPSRVQPPRALAPADPRLAGELWVLAAVFALLLLALGG